MATVPAVPTTQGENGRLVEAKPRWRRRGPGRDGPAPRRWGPTGVGAGRRRQRRASCRSGACGWVPGAANGAFFLRASLVRQSASRIQTNAAKRKKMMPPTIKNPAHEKGVPTRKLTITPPTSSSKPNPMHNQVASRRRDVGLGVDPAPVEAVTGNHPARDGHGLVSSSLFFQRRAPMAAGAFYSIRMNRSPWPGFKLPAVAPFKQVVLDAG